MIKQCIIEPFNFLFSVFSLGEKPAAIPEREEGCGFAQLRVPSAKQQKPLDNISTKLYVGTEVRRWTTERDKHVPETESRQEEPCSEITHMLS